MADNFRVVKDPQAVLNYGFDWNVQGWLGTDTISASTWAIVPSGAVAIDTHTHDTTTTTVWLSGGTHGQTVKARNHIVTADGRTDERTMTIEVRDR